VRTSIGSSQAAVTDIEIDREGRIVAAGNSKYASVARYLPNGRLDASFSGNGKSVPNLYLKTYAIEIDRSGRIVLGGNVEGDLPIAWAVARLKRSGSVDPAFGGGRAVELPAWNGVWDLAIDRRNRILAAGILINKADPTRVVELALARYLSD
jgi:uncharacterized delta-60 repeat protein